MLALLCCCFNSAEFFHCARETYAYQASIWSRTTRFSRGSTRFRTKAFNVPREMILTCPAYSAPTMGARRVHNNPIRFFDTLLMNRLGTKRAADSTTKRNGLVREPLRRCVILHRQRERS